MKHIIPPEEGKYFLKSQELREFNALKATAIDGERFPILAAHWPGLIVVGGKPFCNDNSTLTHEFKTAPAPDIAGTR